MFGSLVFALYRVLLTPVPPTLADVDAGIDDMGLWPIITVGILLTLILFLYRKLARR